MAISADTSRTSTLAAANIALALLQVGPVASATTLVELQGRPAPRVTSRSSIEPRDTRVPTLADVAADHVEFVRAATPYENVIGELRQWNLLGADWDGEGAVAPSSRSIHEAVSFVSLLGDSVALPEPMLLASGHAALYWNEAGLYADIEFLGDGRIAYFIKRNGDKHKGVLAFDSKKMPAVFQALLKA